MSLRVLPFWKDVAIPVSFPAHSELVEESQPFPLSFCPLVILNPSPSSLQALRQCHSERSEESHTAQDKIQRLKNLHSDFKKVLLSLTGFDMLTLVKAPFGRGEDENDGSQIRRHHLRQMSEANGKRTTCYHRNRRKHHCIKRHLNP